MEIKPLEPVIPEFITVHLGPPDSNAQNVTIPFDEYIKNVASGEIYPTWNENAIRANIYAQISFALNKVFVEFYRSQGYDFDITSTTAFDQSFSNGRNIFQNISRIVDDIFTSYIRRDGFLEPLAAQFCNGTTVTCDGLSQWGSQELAEQGYVPYEILTYYYGDDINIVQNVPIENIPESYPGYPLRLGDSGYYVSWAQNQLNRVSVNYPAIPKINPVTGYFDENMKDAVIRFQQVFDLAQDGIIGRNTWYKLVYLYVGLSRLTEINSQGVILENIQRPYPTSGANVAQTDDAVSLIQYYLAVISLEYNTIPYINVTGVMNDETADAIIQFQKQFNLPETGVVDDQTYHEMYRAYISIAEYLRNKRESLPIVRDSFTGNMRVGSSGNSVRNLQSKLNVIAEHIRLPVINVTGYFGPKTGYVISEFQKKHRISQTGTVDRRTYNSIDEEYRRVASALIVNLDQYPGYELRQGMDDYTLNNKFQTLSTPVRNVQIMLRQAAFNNGEIPFVIPDGYFGEQTNEAVRAVQRFYDLNDDGVVDLITFEAIRDEYDKAK